MKKVTRKIRMLVAFIVMAAGAFAQTSTYCNAPSGHLGDPNFGDAKSHVFITITNESATSMSVTVAPRTETGGAPIDFLQVNPAGYAAVTVGTDEGTPLAEYKAILNFETAPSNVTLEILWSNPGWPGRWMVQNVTVPFAASCDGTPPPPAGLKTINYETVGQDWAWTLFENGDNAPALYSVVANPSVAGVNTSATVAKYVVNTNGQPWAGLWSNDLPDFTFSADNSIVKVMVYKDVISDFTVKFENDNSSVAFEKKVPNTVINQWEELTFDFSDKIGTAVSRLVIIPDFPATRTAGSTNYWDNISFNSGTPPVANVPETASPLPTLAASKVISLHSRAYTNVGVDTWRTSWSNAAFSEYQVAGNMVKKYSDLVFVGIETTGANFINATGMTHFHVDVWTPNMSTFKVKLVDFGANAAWSGGDDVEHELSFTPALSSWVSLDIPLADFTGLTTKEHIAQLIFSGAPTGTVFLDNIYFYNSTTTSNREMEAMELTVYPNPVADVLNVRSASEMVQLEITNLVGQSVKQISLKGFEASINVHDLATGNYFVTLTTEDGRVSTHKLVKR